MKVAQKLKIKCAQQRYDLQTKFMNFIQESMKSKTFSTNTFKDFIKAGVDVNFTYKDLKNSWEEMDYMTTPLFQAIQTFINLHVANNAINLNIDVIKALIDAGADVNPEDTWKSPLKLTVESCSQFSNNTDPLIKITQLLLAAGANLNDVQYHLGNEEDDEGSGDSDYDYIAEIKLLLSAGADINQLIKRYGSSKMVQEAQKQLKK